MKKIIYMSILFLLYPFSIGACCEEQGGLMGTYTEEGYAICKDETISYDTSCQKKETTPKEIIKKGCMNPSASNYNPNAEVDDGSCDMNVYGCTNKDAINYNEKANKDDGSCVEKILGCTDSKASNYNEKANAEDKSCTYMAIIVQEETLFFHTTYINDHSIREGEEKILQKGENGSKKIKYKIVVDYYGKELSKEKLDEKVMKEPKTEKIALGTKNSMLDFTILLYSLNIFAIGCNIWYGKNKKNKRPYILKEIQSFHNTEWFYVPVKILFYIFYLLFSVALLDFIYIILYEIKKRF